MKLLLSRRNFLKTSSVAAGAVAFSTLPRKAQASSTIDETISWNDHYGNPPLLGLVTEWSQRIVAKPGDYEPVLRWVNRAEVLPIYEAIRTYSDSHNDVWFDVGEGFIHSANVLPSRELFQDVEHVPNNGFWGEISVPLTYDHWQAGFQWNRGYALPYGAVFKVLEHSTDSEGREWYRLYDDRNLANRMWVQATHVRRITKEEFTPISAEVAPQDKRIEIDLRAQVLTCLEYERVVFATRVATGSVFRTDTGQAFDNGTPPGEYKVLAKTPARHMRSTEAVRSNYDLPGVPWCTYISGSGFAIHGTTWHNDFGTYRSSGCVNVTPDAAKWIYRWTTPHVGPDWGGYQRFWFDRDTLTEATRITAFFG